MKYLDIGNKIGVERNLVPEKFSEILNNSPSKDS